VWKDFSGGLSVELSPKPAFKVTEMTVKWHAPKAVLPAVILAPLRLLAQLKSPNHIELSIAGKRIAAISQFPSVGDEQRLDGYLSVVELLDRAQHLAQVSFPVPEELSQEDVNALIRADRLLCGDAVTGTWKEAAFTVTPTKGGREILESQRQESAFIIAAEETLLLAGNRLPLGLIGNHFLSIRIKNWTDEGKGRGRLTIVPGGVDEFESWRIADEETAINRVIPGVARRFRQQAADLIDRNDQLLRRLAQ
jgi:hypothetical protein